MDAIDYYTDEIAKLSEEVSLDFALANEVSCHLSKFFFNI